jgi:neutral ceramidase
MTKSSIQRAATLVFAGALAALLIGCAAAQQSAAAPPAAASPEISVVGVAPSDIATAREGDLRAGAAVADITPPQSMWNVMMAGYFEPKQIPQGVHDPLHAKALVLDNGQVRLCIVTTDLISIPINLRQAVLAKLTPAAGLAPERVLMCASHTHSGPGGLTEMKFAAQFLGEYKPDEADYVAGKIAGAIESAAAGLRPAKLGYATARVSGFTHNRRGNELIDAEVAVLRVDGADDKPIALLVNFATHPVFLDDDNRLFSADFVGYMLDAIEGERGGVAMFANGAQGDQNPDQDEKIPTAYGRAEAYGKRMAGEALRIAQQAQTRPQVALATALAQLTLPAPTVPVDARQVPIMAVRIGDVLLLGVPGEATAEVGLTIKAHARQLGFDLPLVIGLANEEIAYILSRADYERGEYEAKMSFYGPDLGSVMVAGMTDLAKRLRAPVAVSTVPAWLSATSDTALPTWTATPGPHCCAGVS